LSFRRWYLVFHLFADSDGTPQGSRQALEAAFCNMVRIFTVNELNVKGNARILGKCLEKFTEQLSIHLAGLRGWKGRPPDQIRPAGDIEGRTRQRLIHRQIGMGIAGDTALVTERFCNRLAQNDAAIFDGVMLIDMEVSLGG